MNQEFSVTTIGEAPSITSDQAGRAIKHEFDRAIRESAQQARNQLAKGRKPMNYINKDLKIAQLEAALHDAIEALRPFAQVGRKDNSPGELRLIDSNGTIHVPGSEELTIGNCRAARNVVVRFDNRHEQPNTEDKRNNAAKNPG